MTPQKLTSTSATTTHTAISQLQTWPGAFGAYKYSRDAVKINLGPILLTILGAIGLPYVVQALTNERGGDLSSLLVSPLVTTLTALLWIAGVHRKKLSFSEALRQSWQFYIPILVLTVLIGMASIVSLLLLIIPFFFVFPRLFLAPYFLIDQKLEVMEAFKMSWNKTRGNMGKVWGIIGVTVLMILPALTIIGIPLTIYFIIMYGASGVILYEHITTPKATSTA